MTTAYINRIATAVPPHDAHGAFIAFARTMLPEPHVRSVFDRMVGKARIAHRFSVLAPAHNPEGASVDASRVYSRGRFPTTGERMQLFEKHAPPLAVDAVTKLDLGADTKRVSHVIVTSCTGMYAPGLDLDLVERCGLDPAVERTMVGFMGCYAAINALKLARHIVRSAPWARVLVVNVELCSLHLQETTELDQMLSFLLFGDGCAASLVSADETGFAIDRFRSAVLPNTSQLITWKIRDAGFDMFLSGRVPAAISEGLRGIASSILNGNSVDAIDHWAVHPGGRSVLDAVQQAFLLGPAALAPSHAVLEGYGNMSSASVMFVLGSLLKSSGPGERGCGMSFGPGLTAETMLFHRI